MNRADIKGLSPAQIKEKYSLPYMPTDYVEVEAKNVKASVGIAGPNFTHDGGGTQIELLGRGKFINSKPIPPGGIN